MWPFSQPHTDPHYLKTHDCECWMSWTTSVIYSLRETRITKGFSNVINEFMTPVFSKG